MEYRDVGGRVYNFFIEIKYSFPTYAEGLTRLVGQVREGALAARLVQDGRVVVWSWRAFTQPQQTIILINAGLSEGEVAFVSGLEEAYWYFLRFTGG